MAVDLSFGSSAFPRSREVREFLYNNAVLGQSTRYRVLERLDAFYKCLEYQHQEVAWDGGDADALESISGSVALPHGFTQPAMGGDGGQKKVAEKRPTAPLRLCPMVVDRFTGLLFGRDRVPKIDVEGDAEASDFWTAVQKKTRFWRVMYQARTFGGSMGSSLITAHLRKGRFSFRAHSPKTVMEVAWEDPDLKIPAGVLIQYPFHKELEIYDDKTGQPTGRTKQVTYLYRRIIDEQMDITFQPAEIRGNQLPEMVVDEYQSYEHGLGRFPGVWVQNLPSDDDLDGIPDCDGAYQMFDTIDRQVAQSNKGLMANQDPTLVVSRDKKEELAGIPLRKGSENALNVGQGGSAQYLEMSGGGIQQAREFVRELKQSALAKTQMVAVDPEKMAGAAQSAMAIELLHEPTLEKSGRHREQYGEAIEQLVEIVLDMARKWKQPEQYDGNARAVFDLPPRIEEVDAQPLDPEADAGVTFQTITRTPGAGGIVSLSWGPYFASSPQDKNAEVSMLASAYSAGGIDQETFVRKLAPLLDIEDVEGLLRRVREEAETKRKTASEMGIPGLYPEPEPFEEPGAPPEPGGFPVPPAMS